MVYGFNSNEIKWDFKKSEKAIQPNKYFIPTTLSKISSKIKIVNKNESLKMKLNESVGSLIISIVTGIRQWEINQYFSQFKQFWYYKH